jgi:hypothetical protein
VSRIDKRVSMPEYILVTKKEHGLQWKGFSFRGARETGERNEVREIFADLLRSQLPVLSP